MHDHSLLIIATNCKQLRRFSFYLPSQVKSHTNKIIHVTAIGLCNFFKNVNPLTDLAFGDLLGNELYPHRDYKSVKHVLTTTVYETIGKCHPQLEALDLRHSPRNIQAFEKVTINNMNLRFLSLSFLQNNHFNLNYD